MSKFDILFYMKCISTRNSAIQVDFAQAIRDCMPNDGGLFIPEDFEDLRRWLLYTNEKTSFTSIAGTLTSAFLKDEFSPIICETIAYNAFKNFEPQIKKIDERLYALELFHTPTGSHKDFGISFLINVLETTLTMTGEKAVFLDATVGELGSSLAKMLRGKKNLKAVLLYPTLPKRKIRGLLPSDFVWNGGNILPLEIDGMEEDCHKIVRELFSDRDFVKKTSLTAANTANIGRLLPQSFFYPFAFSRLKKNVKGDIFYAVEPGNYSNLVAGLYSWKLSLPLKGLICPTTKELKLDMTGKCIVMDGMVDFKNREKSDPASPSNLERLEEIFDANSLMLRNFIFPAEISEIERTQAAQELFKKYGIFADKATAGAFAAAQKRSEIKNDDDATIVLVFRDHPALSTGYISHTVGEEPTFPDEIKQAFEKVNLGKPKIKTAREVKEKMKEYGIF